MTQFECLDRSKVRFSFDAWPSSPKAGLDLRVKGIPLMDYGDWVLEGRDASTPGFFTDYIRKADDPRRRMMVRYTECADYRDACECLLKMLTLFSMHRLPRASEIGLDIGDVAFGPRNASEAQDKNFSAIWFVRFNVVVVVRSIGNLSLSVHQEAVSVDQRLRELARAD